MHRCEVVLASTLVELLQRRASSPRGYRYLTTGDAEGPLVEWSFAALDERARAVAARLQSLELGGERALLVFPPGLDFVAGFFGCIYAGVTPVPVAPPEPARLAATLPRLQAVFHDARPPALGTSASGTGSMED